MIIDSFPPVYNRNFENTTLPPHLSIRFFVHVLNSPDFSIEDVKTLNYEFLNNFNLCFINHNHLPIEILSESYSFNVDAQHKLFNALSIQSNN